MSVRELQDFAFNELSLADAALDAGEREAARVLIASARAANQLAKTLMAEEAR